VRGARSLAHVHLLLGCVPLRRSQAAAGGGDQRDRDRLPQLRVQPHLIRSLPAGVGFLGRERRRQGAASSARDGRPSAVDRHASTAGEQQQRQYEVSYVRVEDRSRCVVTDYRK